MTNKKSTKRALLMSALSLLMCVSMLIGSTFAWFTDSVTSGVNKIEAGNLDVEVYYGKEQEPTTNKVTGAEHIFTDVNNNEDILWEPGTVAYANLNVVNEGSLALKYQLAINFTNENYIKENGAKLSQVLKVAFLDAPVSGNREQILDAAKKSGVLLKDLMKSGELLGKDADTNQFDNDVYGVVIYWEPSANDNNWNVYNGRTLSEGEALHIDLGITLVATQKDAEFDSFGKNYDENVAIVATAAELNAAMESGKDVFLTKDLTLDGPVAIPEGAEIVIDGNGYEIASADGRQFFNGTLTNNLDGLGKNSKITVKNVHFVSNGGGYAAIVGPNDAGSMELTFDGCTFENMWCGVYCGNVESDASVKLTIKDCTYINTTFGYSVDPSYTGNYEVTFKNNTGYILADELGKSDDVVVVYNADQLAEKVKNGATNIVLADGEYDVYGCGGKTLTLNGSKKAVLKLYNEGEDGCDYGFDGAIVTFNGVTINTTANTGNYKGYARMNATFNNCDFFGAYTSHLKQTFNNCYFDFNNGYFWVWGAEEVNFNSCKFGGNSKAVLAHGWASSKVNINDCDFAATEKGYTSAGDNTAAVEIDPAGTNTYTINFTGNNTITDSYAGWTRVKDGSTGHDITVGGDKVVSTTAELTAAVAAGEKTIYLANGEYDLKGNMANGLTLIGMGSDVKIANTTNYANNGTLGAISFSVNIENATITNTIYTRADGGKATFTNVTFAKGVRGAYGTGVVFDGCTFNANDDGFALHFESAGSSTDAIKLTNCVFNKGLVRLGSGRTYEFTGCKFRADNALKVWSHVTFDGCSVDGVEITADNISTLLPYQDPAKVTFK